MLKNKHDEEEFFEQHYYAAEVKKTTSHLAGIIPLSNVEANFGSEWPPFLMPVAENFCFIENDVYT
jgi:hypothetical protein